MAIEARSAHRALALIALVIALADLAQVLVLGKGGGAVGGALIYTAVALGASRGSKVACVVALLMPLIPTAVFVGLLGVEARKTLVDAGMLTVFVFQVAAAVAGGLALWLGEPTEMR